MQDKDIYPKVMIFDLDDTLIQLKKTADETWRIISDEYAAMNKNIDSMILYDTVGRIRSDFWSDEKNHLFGRFNLNDARRMMIDKVFKILGLHENDAIVFADGYSARRLDNLRLFPYVHETLSILRKEGVRLVLITNGDAGLQRYKVERFGLVKYFEHIYIESEVGYGKPDVRIFIKALDEMDISAGDVWSVGDNLVWDVKAPQSLGIYSIWNDFEYEGLPVYVDIVPDRIINGGSELAAEGNNC